MLQQYHTIKSRHRDCVLFFRLGDFYEMFYEDAEKVSRELDLVLTARGKGTAHEAPMCGFPHHAAENYIGRLVRAGHKIAICDQIEDPAQVKGIVQRDITRVITAGTWLDEQNHASRLICSILIHNNKLGISLCDLAGGDIRTNEWNLNESPLSHLLSRNPVHECLYPESLEENIRKILKSNGLQESGMVLSPGAEWTFQDDIARKTLSDHFQVKNLHGFGLEERPAARAATGALLHYLKDVNRQPLRHIHRVSLYNEDPFVFISPAAHKGLELPRLFASIDQTRTAMGKRCLQFWINHPLKDRPPIEERQNGVSALLQNPDILTELRSVLRQIPDAEKHLSRLSCGYTHPRDLLAIRNTLALIPELIGIMEPLPSESSLFDLRDIPELREHLTSAIEPDIPAARHEGRVIRKGYHDELDHLKELQNNGREILKDLQKKEIEASGIPSLKIGFNKVFGYYIEITKTHQARVPEHYIRKQTLVNAERYITPELKEHEEKLLSAQEKVIAIEQDLMERIGKTILDGTPQLHEIFQSLARIDALASLAVLARNHGYIRPRISDEMTLDIRGGRHPVVETLLEDAFIANDTCLNDTDQHLVILTGPNMAGKSTYIRQTAILVILAQMGSYIPADDAVIGLVDKVFTRIGAHDDISQGQSTFMVEMNETAGILNNLSARSLVILDEIGRGTSTYDGLSLAWALAEHFHAARVRTLFATHFHELTALADQNDGVKNYNVAVKEWKDEIIFLHKIVPGSTDDSYGIYVAKLAGIPTDIIGRARDVLSRLEAGSDLKPRSGEKASPAREDQLSFLSSSQNPVVDEIRSFLRSIDINRTTPVDALHRIQELKDILEESSQTKGAA